MHFDILRVLSDTGRYKRQVTPILVVKPDALCSPTLFSFHWLLCLEASPKGSPRAAPEESKARTYHIRVEMRRPTPTQSMNTTQRSSFIIFKNPMSSTKPNPTVDTEREIYKVHSGTLQGSGDTGQSLHLQMPSVQQGRHVNRTPKMCSV